MSLFAEVVLATTADDTPPVVWDLQTGSHLAAFKSSGGPCRGCACLGSDAFVCAQQGKDSLHFYAWHQEALLQRCFVAERLLCVAAAHGGSVVAAGAASGFLYVWNTSSGRLLATQKAHTRSVTCVAVDDSGALLFTGGQDCLVSCWWLTELLDTAAAGATQPKWTGSHHSLGVSDLRVGAGAAAGRVYTCALDQTLRVWSAATGESLACIILGSPATALAVAPLEDQAYVGLADGRIARVDLRSNTNSTSGEDAGTSGRCQYMRGHTKAVTTVGSSSAGDLLVSGSEDGSVRLWHCATLQMTRVMREPCSHAVSSILVLPRPPFLHSSSGANAAAHEGAGTASRRSAKPARMLPIAPFSKFAGPSPSLQPWQDGVVRIDGALAHEGTSAVQRSGLKEACALLGGDATARGESDGALGLVAHAAPKDGAAANAAVHPDEGAAQLAEAQKEVLSWKRSYAELFDKAVTALGRSAPLV